MMKSVLCALAFTVTRAAYPTTYPFENEAAAVPGIPAGTPNFTFDPATDTGGYMYHFRFSTSFSWTVDDLPYCPTGAGNFMYGLVNLFNAPPVLGVAAWNCTSKDIVFASADFTGIIATEKVCEVGECCSMLYGLWKFSDDQMTWHEQLSDKSEAALCTVVSEEAYCLLVGGDFQTNCLEYYPGPAERVVMWTCYDAVYLYFAACPVFKQAFTLKYETEPPMYKDMLTNDEIIVLESLVTASDKICHPHSYYNPESESTTGSEVSSTPSSSTTSSETSGGSLYAFVVALAFLL